MATLISHPLLCPRSSYLPFYPSPPSSAPLSLRLRSRQLRCCLSVEQQANKQAPTTPNDDASTLRVAFAAGGTGGHISPALAIADELRIANPSVQILFLGTSDRLESAAIPSAGYAFESFPAPSLFRPFVSLQNLLLPVHLIKSLIQCHKKLLEFKPHVVVGTGGYVSFPVCLAAAMNGIKLVIQEQNSVPGIANWILSFLAEVIFVAFNSTTDCFPRKNKCVVCGNPVRLTLKQFVPKPVARSRFFPRSGKAGNSEGKVLLVLGGSLGANAINIAMLNLYYQMLMENEKLFIIWQTGVESFNEMESLVKNHPRLHLTPFMHSMDLAYAAADLIVSRAGAMTCYEILATGKPCILIPSPDVAEGHQFKNASLMADLAGSKVLTEDELDSTTLAIAIEEILGDENKMADLSERALKVARPNAAAEIAQQILSLVNLPTEKGRH